MPELKSPPKKTPAGKGKGAGKGGGKPKPAGGLNRKVGGLPIWAWGGLVLAAVGLGLWYRSRHGGGNAVAQPETTTSDNSGATGADAGGGATSDGTQSDSNYALAGAIEDLVNQLGAGVTPVTGSPEATQGATVDNGTNPATAGASQGTAVVHPGLRTAFPSPRGQTNQANRRVLKGILTPSQGHKAARAKPKQSKPQKATVNTKHPTSSHPQAAAIQVYTAPKTAPKPVVHMAGHGQVE